MNTTGIYIQTEPEIKRKAEKTARDLGVDLSTVLNGYLKQFIKTKTVELKEDQGETPSPYLKRTIKQAEKNRKTGNHSPVFKTAEESIAWLEKQGL